MQWAVKQTWQTANLTTHTHTNAPTDPHRHRLLANGENVLLYPGGAREAFKRKGEAYQLIWPEKAEFVRLAAKVRQGEGGQSCAPADRFHTCSTPLHAPNTHKHMHKHTHHVYTRETHDKHPQFGATIVPFAAIGADEGVTQLLDIGEVADITRRLPWAAGDQEAQKARIPKARVGVNATMEDVESFGLVSS
jgi:hypothetical protein